MDKAHEIADYMFRTGTERTMSGNYIFDYDELNDLFGTDFPNEDLASDVEIAMYENYNVLDGGAEDSESCFDWMFGLADCIGFRRDCVCKLCGEKIRQVNIGDIEYENWDTSLKDHMKKYHPDKPVGFNHTPNPHLWIDAEKYFEIGENY